MTATERRMLSVEIIELAKAAVALRAAGRDRDADRLSACVADRVQQLTRARA